MQYPSLHQYEPDHGLPLVQLKERRRELVIALPRPDPPTAHELMEIAAVQHAISAFEDVFADLDAVSDVDSPGAKLFLVTSRSV